MKFNYSEETGAVVLSAADLASFARSRFGGALALEKLKKLPDGAMPARRFSCAEERDGVILAVADSPDFLYNGAVEMRAEAKKATIYRVELWMHAALCVLGHLYCRETMSKDVRLIITLVTPDGDEASFYSDADAEFLARMYGALVNRAFPFAKLAYEHHAAKKSFENIAFPFRAVRDGQRDFINETFRCVKGGKRLFVSAPTGIGKTISALYPAVRALGAGFCDKIFCLCAKNITGKASLDAARLLMKSAPELRCIAITAKERVCPFRENGFSSQRCKNGCIMLDTIGAASYGARRDAALLSILEKPGVYTSEMIEKVGGEYCVCPYELSLDLSEHCDIVVCDYNYAFDFSIRFRRYFEHIKEKYVFLIDEAHNLPKRGRDTYSAHLTDSTLERLSALTEGEFSENAALSAAYRQLEKAFDSARNYCSAESELDEGGESHGFYKSQNPPTELLEAANAVSRALSAQIKASGIVSKEAENAASEMRKFLSAAQLFDEHFTFFCEVNRSFLSLHLVCLDPSVLLDRALSAAHASILFSATLSPIDYFADICGCAGCVQLELESPYDPENLCLVVVDSLKTTLAERKATAPELVEVIMSAVEGREGNYIVYFPSYAYLDMVYKKFSRMAGDEIRLIRQTPGMGRSARRDFLAGFEKSTGTTVAFCVLGGMFSEGIDLAGEKLIGAIIVGTGMGSLSSEQNLLSEYYEMTRENGMDYAYTYPGFNNVLQAAGRVIRSENDRGIVMLVDERYNDPKYRRLFPAHWQHAKFTSDPFAAQELIDRFWNE